MRRSTPLSTRSPAATSTSRRISGGIGTLGPACSRARSESTSPMRAPSAIRSAVTARRAESGILSARASAGSSTKATPPQRLTADRPAAPSLRRPLSRTPTTREP